MAILVRFITRKRSGGVAHRDQQVEGTRVRFGRSTDNEAHLPDPRVSLYQAVIEQRANGVYAEALGGADMTVNGQPVQVAQVKKGDVVGIGPYDVTMIDPPGGEALALGVELARPMGDDLEKLVARSKLGLEQTGMSRRRWAWMLTLLVLAVFLVWPVAAFFNPSRVPDTDANKNFAFRPDMMWNSGEISDAHKPIAQQCNRCHQMPFKMVRDEACYVCHESIQHHADPKKFKLPELTEVLCESCHKEHNGEPSIIRKDQKFCADCHGNLVAKAPASTLLAVGDFLKDHHEFRPTVAVDAAAGKVERISLAASPRPKERSGLTFPHDKHLRPGGIRGPEGLEALDCGSCHQVAPGGFLMVPVAQEPHCQRCHELAFDPVARGRRVPHGSVEAAVNVIRDYYGSTALSGGYADPTAPEIVRRLPSRVVLTPSQKREAQEWAETQTQQALQFVFGSKAVCGTCHMTTQSGEAASRKYGVVKPNIAERWLPKGLFRHSSHATETCQRCHGLDVTDPAKWEARVKDAAPPFFAATLALPSDDGALGAVKAQVKAMQQAGWSPAVARQASAAAATVATVKLPEVDGLRQVRRLAEDVVGAAWSDEATDILLPGIAVCRECHVGDSGLTMAQPNNRMPSSCVTCHYYHTPTQGPMNPSAKSADPHRIPGQYRSGGTEPGESLKGLQTSIRNSSRK